MSRKFNIQDVVNERKNELDYSPLFQTKKPAPEVQNEFPAPNSAKNQRNVNHQQSSMPESQNAGIPEKQQSSMPVFQHAGNLDTQKHTTATEKVTFRFHPAGKYAIEDIKTTLARKQGIKASFELIAEEAILIVYEDLLENQNASKLAMRLSSMPENKKSS